MQVGELMTKDVTCCHAEDALSRAAQIMWERDCGIVPVTDGEEHVVALITDRDICMATYTQNRPPSDIRVGEVASRTVYSVAPDDTLETAERIMREQQLRRLPVVDPDGRLVGLLSLSDIASRGVHAHSRKDGLGPMAIEKTLASIGARRQTNGAAGAHG